MTRTLTFSGGLVALLLTTGLAFAGPGDAGHSHGPSEDTA